MGTFWARTSLSDVLKGDLNRWKSDVVVIPGGLTPVLHPLDRCLNKQFKDNGRRKYYERMSNGLFEYNPAEKKAPLRNLVL